MKAKHSQQTTLKESDMFGEHWNLLNWLQRHVELKPLSCKQGAASELEIKYMSTRIKIWKQKLKEWFCTIILPPAKPVFARSLTIVLPSAVTLRRAWNKLKGLPSEKNKKKESEENEKQENGEDDEDEDALSLEEIRKLIVKIPGCTEVSAADVGEWMVCDTSDPGFQILNDDEIFVSVREDVEVEVEEELSADVEVDGGPSASEAFAGLETALKWMERQPECDHLQLLTVKRMRDLAARKRLKTAKQLTLTEMFKKQ
nr:unnamed protein product [Callosobruchus chinensis]